MITESSQGLNKLTSKAFTIALGTRSTPQMAVSTLRLFHTTFDQFWPSLPQVQEQMGKWVNRSVGGGRPQ